MGRRPDRAERAQPQRAALSPRDAQRLGVAHGDRVTVSSNGSRVQATAVLPSAVPEGSIFLEEGISEDSASELDADLVEVSAR
ncbi:MAG TPA: molybdopterin dinucleotide binding domain-containing protein [Solirubrobacteraceae bacterium]|nr:molybdopterin dinucleotide binding domain-containing protein [Solirubrobacteraceae bacterium]